MHKVFFMQPRPNWKNDWPQTQEHFVQWWNHQGPLLNITGLQPLAASHDGSPAPPRPATKAGRPTNPEWFAHQQRARLARLSFPADNLPIAHVDYGCVQLAACFGAEPSFEENTVWYEDLIADPESCPPLLLTKQERWWQTYKQVMLKLVEVSHGDFLVGMPAFGSNMDVLAELRGTQNVLYDLIDRPDWVKGKLEEVNEAFFAAFDDYYEHIRLYDGSSCYTFFHLWGPGKVSQVQCDFAAMISPDMFAEFVVPPLTRQCAWLDHSLFHLDGPSCICHLDHLLAIKELDAVQWTSGAGQPPSGDPVWYGLYDRILKAGKSVQIIDASVSQARHIFDRFGPAGVWVFVQVQSEEEVEDMVGLVDDLR